MTFTDSPDIVGTVNEDSARPLGEWLRQRREERDISLEQAATDTRIRLRYLEALEADEFEALPDPVVGRGFLRNYAAYLGLDLQEAVRRFAPTVAPPEPEAVPEEEPSPFNAGPFRPVPLHDMPGWHRGRGWRITLVVVLAVALAVLAWLAYPRLPGWIASLGSALEPAPTRQATVALLPTATHTATRTAATTTAPPQPGETTAPTRPPETLALSPTPALAPSFTPTPSPPVYTGIFLELIFTDTSWIQVAVDGVRQFQGELEADTYRSWYAEERLELRIGNAGVVEVTINGQKLGTLGAQGDVVERIFEKVGEQVNEATPTSTPTGTPPTPTPSPTIAPPATPITPTATITTTAAITPTAGP